MRLTSGASDGTRNYIVDGIRYVCANFKERAPGTHSERKAQSFLAGELEQWADDVQVENFDVHPHAFMGSRRPVWWLCSPFCFIGSLFAARCTGLRWR